MLRIITGETGSGKTKTLIEQANSSIGKVNGSLVYIDKSNQNIYGLSNRIRLINSAEFHIENYDMFRGFLYGVVSQNRSTETIFIDGFKVIAHLNERTVERGLQFLYDFSEEYGVDIMVTVSVVKDKLPGYLQKYVLR